MSEEIDKEKAKQFLKEYYKLCVKHGFIIDACGCCDSPWLTNVFEPEFTEEDVAKFVRTNVEHLMHEAGFNEEEIKSFIQELAKEA